MPGEDPPVKIPTLPFKPPEFNWNASNLYSQFKLFKTKVEFALKGTYKENPGHANVSAILNWLGDSAFEVYANFIWPDPVDKDDLLKVLKTFKDYFKLAQNKYHCWYSLEVVEFLFLTHNQNACVHEDILKSMKDSDGLNDILGYACLVEGTQHSESMSKAYLDIVKIPNSSVKVDAFVQKTNKHNSKFHGKHNGSKHRSQSKGGGNCHNYGTIHPPKHCPAYDKTCYNCNKKEHFKPLCRSRQCSQSGSR